MPISVTQTEAAPRRTLGMRTQPADEKLGLVLQLELRRSRCPVYLKGCSCKSRCKSVSKMRNRQRPSAQQLDTRWSGWRNTSTTLPGVVLPSSRRVRSTATVPELLVLGANAKLRLRLAARLEPRDQFLAGFDRRHVDLVASHAALPAKGPRPYTAAVRESNWSCTARAAQRRVICLQPRAYVRPASVFLISSPHT